MGLDGVELIMAVEEAFGVSISDEEAGQIRTPRQLCDVVAGKVRTVEPSVCLTQRSFYLLRRTFRGKLAVPRSRFRPETPLEQLVPLDNRRVAWSELREDVGAVVWPKMRLPTSLTTVFVSVAVVLWAALAWRLTAAKVRLAYSVIAAGLLSVAVLAGAISVRPLHTSLAGQTVGTLAEYVATFNPFLLSPESTELTPEKVRLEVRKIIIEQLGVRADFSDDADFVHDLGVS
jgi:acyl carrier protein